MGGGAYEKGRLDRCQQQQLTLSLCLRNSSSSHCGRRRYAFEAWYHPRAAHAAQYGPHHGSGRPQWVRPRTPPGPLAPQAGCEHGLPLPTLSLAVPTTQPKASTLRCGPRRQPPAEQATPYGGPEQADRLAACSLSYATIDFQEMFREASMPLCPLAQASHSSGPSAP
jgi:hypothetical protein